MKIALVTRRYPPLIGGAEKVLSYLAPALAKEGARVTVVTSRPPGPFWAPPSTDVPVVRLPTSWLRFVGTSLYMQSLNHWLMTHAPDLIYVSMLKHDAFVAVSVGRKLKIPVVLRPEGAGATGDLAWQRWGRFGARIGKRCKRADAFVAISPAVHTELIVAGYDPAKIHDLPNGVPVPDQAWEPEFPMATRFRAAFVGRLAPEKGLDVLINAWAIVTRHQPQAHLTLIGEGPQRRDLETRIRLLRLDSSVHLIGSQEDPLPLLRRMNLFVLPSREEGMSIALLEAMALGLPVVATDIPGNRGLVDDGVHGRLVPPEDPQALAEAILKRWYDNPEAVQMAEVARRRVVENFSIEAVARKHLDLFRRLVRGSDR